MRTTSTILGVLAVSACVGCAEGTGPTPLDRNPFTATSEDAGSMQPPSGPGMRDAGPPPVKRPPDAGRPHQDDPDPEDGGSDVPDPLGTDGGGDPDAAVNPPVLGGLVIYEDGISTQFAPHVPHSDAASAQESNGDAAYLVVDPAFAGKEALAGKSLEVEFVTENDKGNFGVPLAFWLGSIGWQDGVSEDISKAESIRFSIRTASGTGVLNMLAMSSTATSTSRNVTVTSTWQEVKLSTGAGADWVVYHASSFEEFVVLQLNFLGGANPPNGFKGGAHIYIDNVYIE